MEDVITALSGQQQELDLLLRGLEVEDWERPSRCRGWKVGDVILHLAQVEELLVASGEGRFAQVTAHFAAGPDGRARSADEAVALMVETERGAPGPAVSSRWRAAVEAERALLGACDPRQRLPWVSGDLPIRTVATTLLAETWIHTGDVAWALSVEVAPTDRLWHIARLAWRTLPYAFARSGQALHGPVALELTAPDGATWDFSGDDAALTTVRGPAEEFCLVAGRRLDPEATALVAEGHDADAVLSLVRTYA